MAKKPADFKAFSKFTTETGYSVKRGAHTSFRCTGQQQSIRLRCLGEGYSDEDVHAVKAGKKDHSSNKKCAPAAKKGANLLIDNEAKLCAGKGAGYRHWAKQ